MNKFHVSCAIRLGLIPDKTIAQDSELVPAAMNPLTA